MHEMGSCDEKKIAEHVNRFTAAKYRTQTQLPYQLLTAENQKTRGGRSVTPSSLLKTLGVVSVPCASRQKLCCRCKSEFPKSTAMYLYLLKLCTSFFKNTFCSREFNSLPSLQTCSKCENFCKFVRGLNRDFGLQAISRRERSDKIVYQGNAKKSSNVTESSQIIKRYPFEIFSQKTTVGAIV